MTFSNGSTVPFTNYAYIQYGTWDTEIANGDDFTNAFCIIPAQPSTTTASASSIATASATSSAAASATATATTYPDLFPYTPVARDPNNQVAGYFLNGSDYADTAVLWISSFAQESAQYADPDTITSSFQNTTREFFAALRAAPSRTKLIIDLSGNGGGNTLLPDDTVSVLSDAVSDARLISAVQTTVPRHRTIRRFTIPCLCSWRHYRPDNRSIARLPHHSHAGRRSQSEPCQH